MLKINIKLQKLVSVQMSFRNILHFTIIYNVTFLSVLPLKASGTGSLLNNFEKFTLRQNPINKSGKICNENFFANTSLLQDTIETHITKKPKDRKRGITWARFSINFGNHQNFTKATNSGLPRVETAGFFVSFNFDIGLMFKSVYVSGYYGTMFPIPLERFVNGYKHKNGMMI